MTHYWDPSDRPFFRSPGNSIAFFGQKPSLFEKNLDLTFEFARSLLYYLGWMLNVDPSTSKTTFRPAPAGIAAEGRNISLRGRGGIHQIVSEGSPSKPDDAVPYFEIA